MQVPCKIAFDGRQVCGEMVTYIQALQKATICLLVNGTVTKEATGSYGDCTTS